MAALDFPATPSNGDTYEGYVYDATDGVWNRQEAALEDLSNATITGTPADNEVLAYDSSSGEWINQTAAEVGVASIVNTDGNPGSTIYVGATDPNTLYTLETGDVWIEQP